MEKIEQKIFFIAMYFYIVTFSIQNNCKVIVIIVSFIGKGLKIQLIS